MNALVTYSQMIKLSHSVFALPFALAAAVLAARDVPVTGWQIALIVLCMVTARSSAMGVNRLVDRQIDAANPRTANRAIPMGAISVPAAWGFSLASAALFVLFAGLLGPLPLALSPIALVVIWGYSFTKRWTWLCHGVLGVALGLAPSAVFIALSGHYGWVPWWLSVAVASWVAGFDIIYSCQDAAFDRSNGLYSAPAVLGLGPALAVSAGLHGLTVVALVALPWFTTLGWAYWAGIALITGILVFEHRLVTPSDLSKVGPAFFELNGYVSLVFLLCVWLAV